MNLNLRYRAALLGGLLFGAVLLLTGCASVPAAYSYRVENHSPGIEVLYGQRWRAVRFQIEGALRRAAISQPASSPASSSARKNLSRHAQELLDDPAVIAVLSGSPHTPVRYSSGRVQAAVGFYRTDGNTWSDPDGQHDAVGIDEDGNLHLLSPQQQRVWTDDAVGGFYAILRNGVPLNPVPIRDAVGAVGWSTKSRSVIFLAIQGSEGLGFSYGEAGELLKILGAEQGAALDGGNSLQLSWKANGTIKNFPPFQFYRAMPNYILLEQIF